MLNKKLNLKKILAYALLGALVIFIAFLSWIPLDFNIQNLNVEKWISNSLICMGIMVCSIILGEILCEDKLKQLVNGLYQIALKAYNDIKKRLQDTGIIVFFSQWYIDFKAKELLRKKEGYLVDHGFDQQCAHLIVRYIERDDIEEMCKGVYIKKLNNGKEIKFKRIHEDEYEVLKEIFSTDFIIDAPKYTYYLSAFGDSSSQSVLEDSKRIEKKERMNKTFNRVFKITLSLFVSFIWGLATVKDIMEGGAKEAVANTLSRFIALFGGLLSGVLTSVVAVKLASQKLDNKTQVLSFMEIDYNTKAFVPKTYDELIEEEIKEENDTVIKKED